MQRAATCASSSGEKTLPVGLCGELRSTSLVRGPTAAAKLVRIEVPIGRVQAHRARHGAGHGRAGGVGVVHRLEHDDLVAGLAQRQHGGGDGLRGPDGDEHIGLGMQVQAVPGALVGRHGLAQLGDAVARRVLVPPFPDGGHRHLAQLFGPVGVGEALAEVDRARRRRQLGHGGEDRGGEGLQPPGQVRVPRWPPRRWYQRRCGSPIVCRTVLSIANYNMHCGIDGWGRPYDYLAAIASLDADVIVLEETWAARRRRRRAASPPRRRACSATRSSPTPWVRGAASGPSPSRPTPGGRRAFWAERNKALYMDGIAPPAGEGAGDGPLAGG